MKIKLILFICIIALSIMPLWCKSNTYDTYKKELWMSYAEKDNDVKKKYLRQFETILLPGSRFDSIIMNEIALASKSLLGKESKIVEKSSRGIIMRYSPDESLGKEGYTIKGDKKRIFVEAHKDAGFLYATYHLIRLVQTERTIENFFCREIPAFDIRQLNHWDDLDGNIERGYAGKSLWEWEQLPELTSPRYEAYARANASLGINGVVLNNVNADPRIIRTDYLKKVAVIADILRKYNIKVYLSLNFASPMHPSKTPDKMKAWGGIGNLDTADPRNTEVRSWWEKKIAEIYQYIPDFGGFLVKANSEGMPGPQDYGCTHSDGANFLARLIKPYNGLIIWRAFVYQSPNSDPDRYKRAYQEFMPLDGMFDDNVILQIKNGPLDFQPSEPASPLFGSLTKTNIMAELQITQEYMGHSTYLVYLLPMWKKFFEFDTYCKGEGSHIKNILTGKTRTLKYKAIAGVANTGSSPNWTSHDFAQANWYAYGRLAWNPESDMDEITYDWIKMTWNTDKSSTETIYKMMLPSWDSFMRSSSPLGLGITTNMIIHYDPDFDFRNGKEWTANGVGVGTDRSSKGSNYVSQYFEPNRTNFDNIETCPEELLLGFHFVKWNYKMKNGQTFYEYLMNGLKSKIETTKINISEWKKLENEIDPYRHYNVSKKLQKELHDATIFYEKASDFFTRMYNNKK